MSWLELYKEPWFWVGLACVVAIVVVYLNHNRIEKNS